MPACLPLVRAIICSLDERSNGRCSTPWLFSRKCELNWMEGAELFHLFGDDVAAPHFDLNGNGRPDSDAPDDLAADPGAVG